MLLYLVIPCFSFILFLKSLPLKPLPPWASEMRLMSLWFWKELSSFVICGLVKIVLSRDIIFLNKEKSPSSKMDKSQEIRELSVLDLPELALECILEKLPPSGLCHLSGVCRSFRDKCRSDYLWEKHMKQKWGRIIGRAAHRQWKWHVASGKNFVNLSKEKQNGLLSLFSPFWPLSWIGSQLVSSRQKSSFPVDSTMSWYLALENGKFWFPAQVYNRENGHVGFMLSCYDAELCYDSSTDTFQARYPPHGRRAMAVENNVPWERLRAPPLETPPHDLHISDCLNDLRPGDHIEIQWRRNKEFPYGWWYGVVGHLDSCDGNEIYCRCHENDMVVLEFNQYTPGSRWRCTRINRKDHREEGNEADGFYGGIRKLTNLNEISTWKHLWPTEVLE